MEEKLEYDGFIEVTMEDMKNVHLVPTADEVVKVLEECFAKGGEMSCKDCSVYTGNGLRDCMKSVGINALNLIHRLQDDNKRLIEELKEEKVWFSELLQTKNELQEQVDELTQRYLEESKERCKFEQLYDRKCHDKNIGIGVQRAYWEKKVQQAIKDTAKEICDLILEHWEKKQFVECDWLRVAISERYGVEVD